MPSSEERLALLGAGSATDAWPPITAPDRSIHPDALGALLDLAREHDLPLGRDINVGMDPVTYGARLEVLLMADLDGLRRWARVLGADVVVRPGMDDPGQDWYQVVGSWLTVKAVVRRPGATR